MFSKLSLITALVGSVSAGTVLWDGRFNDVSSNADIAKWSWSNQVGPYQYYIHGSGSIDKYVNLSPSFRNPVDTSSKQGAKITIDSTSHWNGQNMFRTELIPSTSAAINKGKVFYHFSVKTTATNAPIKTAEHQVAFFESHFTELKFGGDAGGKLQWHVGGQSKWETELVADEWHNVAYEIDFSGGSVTFWHSTGAAALTKTAGPITASPSSDGKDFHVGVLRLPGSGDADATEDWYFSGVYVESGELTTSVSGPGAAAGGDTPAASPAASSAPAATPAPVASSAAAPAASSSVVAEVKTPVASSTPVAAVSSAAPVQSSAAAPKPVASSTFATSYKPEPKPTPSPAAPAPSAGAGSGSGSGSNAPLPKEFTLNEFIAWLKAKHGIN